MSVKQNKNRTKVSKKKANDEALECEYPQNIIFSFKNISTREEFTFEYFKKVKDDFRAAIKAFMLKLSIVSLSTFERLLSIDKKHGGMEHLSSSCFYDRFINSLPIKLQNGEKLYVVRFGGKDYRLIARRGSKCGRVFDILGIEFELGTAYSHGS